MPIDIKVIVPEGVEPLYRTGSPEALHTLLGRMGADFQINPGPGLITLRAQNGTRRVSSAALFAGAVTVTKLQAAVGPSQLGGNGQPLHDDELSRQMFLGILSHVAGCQVEITR